MKRARFNLPAFPRNLWALFGLMITDVACARAAFPILTLVFFDAHSSLFSSSVMHESRSYWYGLCIALPNAASLIATPILCSLSDRYGRKPLLVISSLGIGLASIIAALAVLNGNLSWLMFSMLLSGLFSHSNPIAQAVVGDSTTGKQKLLAMGWLQSFIALGAFIGPLIGGHLAKWHTATLHFSPAFFLAAGFGVLGIMMALFLLKESLFASQRQSNPLSALNCFRLLTQQPIKQLSLILFFSQLTWSLFYQYISPLLKVQFHVDAPHLGLFMALIALWLVLASSFGITLIKRHWHAQSCLAIGLGLVFIGSILVILGFNAHQAWLIWLSAIPVAAGDVIAFSAITTHYSDKVSPHQQGQVMGLCYLIKMGAWTVTSFTGGILMAANPLLPAWIAPLGILVAISMYRLCRSSELSKSVD